MKVLFTGSSSFTGYWFIKSLKKAGHEVVATFQKKELDYDEVRGERVQKLANFCHREFECSLGDKRFFEIVNSEGQWDLFCHHAADVTDYKNPQFDYLAAVENNTKNIPEILDALNAKGCSSLLVTGSVFEPGEGKGSDNLRAFSPYGLSKVLSFEVIKYSCQIRNIKLGKFVIPNPFGPYEEPRFTSYLMRCWLKGETPTIKTPDYVRDNIHVGLLADYYSYFANQVPELELLQKINPSGYVESQGKFTERVSDEAKKRLGIPCEFHIDQQVDFPDPRERKNMDRIDEVASKFNEEKAWDEFISFYRGLKSQN